MKTLKLLIHNDTKFKIELIESTHQYFHKDIEALFKELPKPKKEKKFQPSQRKTDEFSEDELINYEDIKEPMREMTRNEVYKSPEILKDLWTSFFEKIKVKDENFIKFMKEFFISSNLSPEDVLCQNPEQVKEICEKFKEEMINFSKTVFFLKIIDKNVLKNFKEYCKKAYCLESLEFHEKVEDWKKINPKSFKKKKSEATKIYQGFLAENSPNQINVSGHLVTQFNEDIEKPDLTKIFGGFIFEVQRDLTEHYGSLSFKSFLIDKNN
jgi:hypothetical protein